MRHHEHTQPRRGARRRFEPAFDGCDERGDPRPAAVSQHGVAQVLAQDEQRVAVVAVRVVLPAERHEQVDHPGRAGTGVGIGLRRVGVEEVPGAGERRPQQRRLGAEALDQRGRRQPRARGQHAEGQGVGPARADDEQRGVEEVLVGDRPLAGHGVREYKRMVVHNRAWRFAHGQPGLEGRPSSPGPGRGDVVKAAGLDLKVAIVEGDDLIARADELSGAREMFSGEAFPPREKVVSINAYLGAFPVAEALMRGADIVITGRNVDSAVTLGACIHAFGWSRDQADLLAAGSLCGHILECGAQATGGNYTDWESVADTLWEIGYPIAEVGADGAFTVTKPEGSGGAVTIGTVGEQMLYEIGDPQAYVLPDVVCDFSGVKIEQAGKNRVAVSGARGHPAPDTYKVSTTYEDGFRAGAVWFFYGEDAAAKARLFAESALKRARAKLRAANAPDYDEVLVEVMGDESLYGAESRKKKARDVALKVAVKHRDQRAAGLILKELTGHGLAGPPGLSGFAGSRPAPSPVVRLFSFLTPKASVPIRLRIEDEEVDLGPESGKLFDPAAIKRPAPPALPGDQDLIEVPLIRLAYARSGDKGDNANIGVLARDPSYAPWIWAKLTEAEVARRFAHFLKGKVERFLMPGASAMNFLLHNVLGGGGVASLRNDPQAKGYSQILLQTPIPIPRAMAENL